MIARSKNEFLNPAVAHSPRYSGTFGASLRGLGILHDLDKSSDQFQMSHVNEIFKAHEGIYLTTVQYQSPEALHSMRLLTPALVTYVRFVSDEDIWIATDDLTEEYGVGDSWDDAINDYVQNIHSMASWFKLNPKQLGSLMNRRLQVYRGLFQEL